MLRELDVQLVVVLVEVHRLGDPVREKHLAAVADGRGGERNRGRLITHVDVGGGFHDVADADRRLHVELLRHHVHNPVELRVYTLRVFVPAQGEEYGQHVFRIAVGGDAAEVPGDLADDVLERIVADEVVGIVRPERILARDAVDHDDAVVGGQQVDAEFLVDLEIIRYLGGFAVQQTLQNALLGIRIGGDQPLLELVGLCVHFGKRLAELVELVARAAVRRGLFDVVAVEHLDRGGEACARPVGDDDADGEDDQAGKRRQHGDLRQAAENIRVGDDVENREAGNIRARVSHERACPVAERLGKGAGGAGQLRYPLEVEADIGRLREFLRVVVNGVGGKDVAVPVE